MATWPTITDDDGTNTTGTVVNNTNVWTPIQNYIGAAWSAVAYSAGNFVPSAGTWTVASGDQIYFRYVECGKTMMVLLVLTATTVSGGPAGLGVTIPNSRTAVAGYGSFHFTNNGTAGTGLWVAGPGTGQIVFYLDANSTAWAASTNNTNIYATCVFEIS